MICHPDQPSAGAVVCPTYGEGRGCGIALGPIDGRGVGFGSGRKVGGGVGCEDGFGSGTRDGGGDGCCVGAAPKIAKPAILARYHHFLLFIQVSRSYMAFWEE